MLDILRNRCRVAPAPRGTLALVCAVLTGFAAPAAAQSGTPWLHVEIFDSDESAQVEVNVPLAAAFVLGDTFGDRVREEIRDGFESNGDVEMEIGDLRALWQALRAAPGASVSLGEAGENLTATMDGDEVRVEGAGEDGTLRVRIPVTVGDALFGGDDPEDLDLEAAIRSLEGHEGDLVTVDGGDSRVRIWIGPQ